MNTGYNLMKNVPKPNKLQLALYLSAIVIFFFNVASPSFDYTIKGVLIISIIIKAIEHHATWAIIASLLIMSHFQEWYIIDNHIYLMILWSLNLSIVLYQNNYNEKIFTLQLSSRIILGLLFLFATVWKIVTPEFMNGNFFQYLLLGGDSRFDQFSILLTGISPETLESNRKIIDSLQSIEHRGEVYQLETTDLVDLFAILLTWWTILLEGLIAILFLIRNNLLPSSYKHIALLIFTITTYPVANVITFGLLLICIGLSTEISNVIKWIYIVIFIILFFFI